MLPAGPVIGPQSPGDQAIPVGERQTIFLIEKETDE